MFMAGLLAEGIGTAAQLQPYPREAFLVSRPPLQLTNTSLVTRTRTVGYAQNLSGAAERANETTPKDEQPMVDQFRRRMAAANKSLAAAQVAIQEKDEERLKAAMKKFYEVYGPVGKTAP
jgi:hypothetical protein